jgi:hypothetical protein
MIRKTLSLLLCIAMILTSFAAVLAVDKLPDVSDEMTDSSFWTAAKGDKDILLTADEIKAANELYIKSPSTNFTDLKAVPETIDGYAQRTALEKGAKADAEYYLGWTYDKDGNLLTQSWFDKLIANTLDRNVANPQKVRWGIVVNRTVQRTFPSFEMILDDPSDPDFDYQNISSLRVNEAVAILAHSADGKFCLARSIAYTGWVDVNDIAICKDRDEWLSAWDFDASNALVVCDDKIYTEISNYEPGVSGKVLTMGTVLQLASDEDQSLYSNRSSYYAYPVYIPGRDENGNYIKLTTVIPQHHPVSVGYLPLTREKIINTAFLALGDAYGWGGMLYSNDCSGYIRDIYKCFGIELPRNTTWQKNIAAQGYDMGDMCSEEKLALLDTLPAGSTLFFSGHEMMYLGKRGNDRYVISSVSNIMDPDNSNAKKRTRTVMINDLDIKRANGNTWLASLNYASVPFRPLIEGKTYETFQSPSYHDAVAFVMKNKIMQGSGNAFFMPDAKITAEQIDIVSSRTAKLLEIDEGDERIRALAAGLKGLKRSDAAQILMDFVNADKAAE